MTTTATPTSANPAFDRRRGGVILHPTSLPGPHGSGDLGPAAHHFVDWLGHAGCGAWQMLPLTPIGPGNSPYASVSAFAGEPMLIALEPLAERGWLAPTPPDAPFVDSKVEYARVVPWRRARLLAAADAFFAKATPADREAFNAFCAGEAHWLDDYTLFMALDESYRERDTWNWTRWDAPLARREPRALAEARRQHGGAIAFWSFVQWCFHMQWQALKRHANANDVRIVGDLPIFVAHHSADCWARPDLFRLDPDLEPTVVAGVPPDYFSATGQRWGNPLYDWAAMQQDGFAWWVARMRHALQRADIVRVDHFRGFAAYWEIDAACPTAIDGRWVPAPGGELLATLKQVFGGALPVIAEDLGVITPDVEALRDRYALPGMKVLQFAFGDDADHPYLPHNHSVVSCVYTGTHDNDTSVGWWRHGAGDRERRYAATYLDLTDEGEIHWRMIRAAWASPALLAVCPMQDVLGLGSEHRMNTPGITDCWTWRFEWQQVLPDHAHRMARLAAAFGRGPFRAIERS